MHADRVKEQCVRLLRFLVALRKFAFAEFAGQLEG